MDWEKHFQAVPKIRAVREQQVPVLLSVPLLKQLYEQTLAPAGWRLHFLLLTSITTLVYMVHLGWDLARHHTSNCAWLFILSVLTTQLGLPGLPLPVFVLIHPPVPTFLSPPMTESSWERQVAYRCILCVYAIKKRELKEWIMHAG